MVQLLLYARDESEVAVTDYNVFFRVSVFGCALALGGCGGPAEAQGDEARLASKQDPIYAGSWAIWRRLKIPVCWENPTDNNATGRGWVKQAITDTWQAHSKVSFTGWGLCQYDADGIRIRIEDTSEGAHTVALGRDLGGVEDGMSLNFTFNHWNTAGCASPASQREFCIKAIAVHEFGHALGWSHEQNRPDRPASCHDAPQGEDGDTLVGPFDDHSVMNYCENYRTTLSTGDILGLQAYYGDPDAGTKRIAAVNLGRGKFYTFRGSLYSRIDAYDRVMDSGFPRTIANDFKGWPPTWSDGVDAAVNLSESTAAFFRNDQFLKYDSVHEEVMAGFPKSIAQYWGNWPANWTKIDAAVSWHNGKIYFFRGSEFLQYDKSADRVDPGYPKLIADRWAGLFASDIDAAFNDGDGYAYFFKNNQYDRVDVWNDKQVDEGYPAVIVGNWPGVLF